MDDGGMIEIRLDKHEETGVKSRSAPSCERFGVGSFVANAKGGQPVRSLVRRSSNAAWTGRFRLIPRPPSPEPLRCWILLRVESPHRSIVEARRFD